MCCQRATGRFLTCDPGCCGPENQYPLRVFNYSGASGFALSVGKQGFYAQADMSDAQAFHYAKNTIVMNNCSEDAQGGITAFLEKKTTEWKNQ